MYAPPKFRSYLLVALQLLCIALFAAAGHIVARNSFLLIVEAGAWGLGVWAIGILRLGKFNITPDVPAHAEMTDRGPYRLIRHPMYTSLIVGAGALVADDFSWLRCSLWICLAAVLVMKLHYEEKLLRNAFSGYEDYAKRTYRLIPFMY
ncbi:MAG: isoprenylcysteine carboxylmethyltransferase family protein [Bacteroidetes bacterium]|nr:isoprenylcysteine carboxylmethyltransferase family protein [Bacteroidota bacterium]MCW5894745.1 isoprenylcysteine carboxylmethyltransferase family protein [Bacteroidota bacterium]